MGEVLGTCLRGDSRSGGGNGRAAALPARRAPAAPRQLGRGSGLIEKDEPGRIEPGLPGDPGVAWCHDIGAGLFPGRRRLFVKGLRGRREQA